MARPSRIPVDRFLLAIIAAAVLASIFPAMGPWVDVVDGATTLAIAVLFFLYGARLSPSETIAGLKHWRLHVTILTFTYVLFPLIGLAAVALPGWAMDPGLQAGLLYLTLVPVSYTHLVLGVLDDLGDHEVLPFWLPAAT